MKDFLEVDKFATIILADGSNFPDALTGSYLSISKMAPIILVNKSRPIEAVEYVKNNLKIGGEIYILGGYSAVPQSIE